MALASGFLLLTAWPASAHAVLVGSSPADGAVLDAPPARVLLHFSEAVQIRPGGVRVLDVQGSAVSAGDARLGPGDTVTVNVRPGLPAGTYLVSWRVVSDDSHPVTGGLLFGVGAAPSASPALQAAAPAGDEVLDVLAGLARGVGYAGMALAVGATAFLVLVGPARGRRTTADRRSGRPRHRGHLAVRRAGGAGGR